MNKQFIVLILCLALLSTSCTKKSALDDLSPQSSTFAATNYNTFFVVDSTAFHPAPSVTLYYHIRYDLIDPASVSKIVINRDGEFRFRITPGVTNSFSPTDMTVAHGHHYNYSFAVEAADGTLSNFSAPYSVYLP